MNKTDNKYTQFALCREMLETPEVIRQFQPEASRQLAELVDKSKPLMLTGEGSSRIFPAKRARKEALQSAGRTVPVTEGATQSLEYDLSGYTILGASNSGRTRELVRLFKSLKENGHSALGGITAFENTALEETCDKALVLSCGPENAVAATKSVVEQGMVWQAVLADIDGVTFPSTSEGANLVESALTTKVPEEFGKAMAGARTIFFAGRNDGVAEELTLKTNEIVRKQSDYLEGTYAAHGIEEIMHKDDIVILVDPFPAEEAKLKECLADAVGVTIFAISDRETLFPTLKVPANGPWKDYILLTAGWNLLVEAGIAAGIDLDKPERARKVGNEVD